MCNPKLVVLFCCVLIMVIVGCAPKQDSYEGYMQQRLTDACVVSESPSIKVLDNNEPPISSEQPGDLSQVFVVFDIDGSTNALPLPLVSDALIIDVLKKCYGITLPSEKGHEK
jgi:hypothetical protein